MPNLTKNYKDFNTLIMLHLKHHGLNYFGLSYHKGIIHAQNYLIHMHTPLNVSQKYIGLHNISFDTWKGIF
jgi:hypothetical protein